MAEKIVLFGGLTAIFYIGLSIEASKLQESMNETIMNAFMKGSGKEIWPYKVDMQVIERPAEEAKINELLLKESESFKVVIGPTGTGKTYLTRKVCKTIGRGVIYNEIPGAPGVWIEKLAKSVGMRIPQTANSLWDVLCYKFLDRWQQNIHKLPKDYTDKLAYVLTVVARMGEVMREEHGFVPTLVIDGIDLLAKYNSDAFIQLVNMAKVFATEQSLKIVLVSSEGHVMPLIRSTSSQSRMAEVVEILDIDENKAIDYLMAMNVPRKVATSVVDYCGGRVVFLQLSSDIYESMRPYASEEAITERIKNVLYSRYALPALTAINLNGAVAKDIVKKVFTLPNVTLKSLTDSEMNEKGKIVKQVVAELVTANLLRYDSAGSLKLHSRIIEAAVKEEFQF